MESDMSQAQPLLQSEPPFPLNLLWSGFLLLALFFSAVALWTALAPIEGAVVTSGVLGVSSHRKQIQHLEGGIVKSIAVVDGDKVSKGDLLVQLETVQAATELRKLQGRLIETQAEIARLNAEMDGQQEIQFPQQLLDHQDEPSVQSVLHGQSSLLRGLRQVELEKRAILQQQIVQAEEQIKGLRARIKAKTRQRRLMQEELKTLLQALKDNLIPKASVLKLRQKIAQTDGDQAALRAEISKLEQKVLEMKLQKNEQEARRLSSIMEQLRSLRASEYDLSQKLIAAKDVLARTSIRSPIDGIVVNLQIHSPGGVIEPGQQLMEVIPVGDELIVETFIDPDDIDEVHVGMKAQVRLTSVSRRQRTPYEGVLTDLSADRLTDPQSGQDFYRARIRLLPASLQNSPVKLVAGMGVDVYLKTMSRTPLEYLLSPLTRSLQQGMREN